MSRILTPPPHPAGIRWGLNETTYLKYTTCYLAHSHHFLNLYHNYVGGLIRVSKLLSIFIETIVLLIHLPSVLEDEVSFLTYHLFNKFYVPTIRFLLSKKNSASDSDSSCLLKSCFKFKSPFLFLFSLMCLKAKYTFHLGPCYHLEPTFSVSSPPLLRVYPLPLPLLTHVLIHSGNIWASVTSV